LAAFPRSVAVAVESFDAYRRLFGGFEGPGLLPYAVASFFENGGIRAYVVRIVHQHWLPDGSPDAVANAGRVASAGFAGIAGALVAQGGNPVTVRARNEGAWGAALSATLSFSARPLGFELAGLEAIAFPIDSEAVAGSLLRVTFDGGAQALRFIASSDDRWAPEPARTRRRLAVLDAALPVPPVRVELVEAALDVTDGEGRAERLERLGLSAAHPRWLAATVYGESELLYPEASWIDSDVLLPDAKLTPFVTRAFSGGGDEYAAIIPDDFFDDFGWTLGDPYPGAGIHALVDLPDLAALAVPDLYSPGPLVAPEDVAVPISQCGPTFERAVAAFPTLPPVAAPDDLLGLRLNPELPDDLARITALQSQLVDLADALRSFVVLLDVPPRLHQRQILKWRAAFGSAYAAAYHPWLRVPRPDDGRDVLIRVNPSAIAAGIIAQREIALGIPHGPANIIAAGVVDVEDLVSPARHDELHPAGINVFLRERDGVRLSAARTLGRDPAWRQLSVRRLVTMLRRTLDQQMQWAVFEPNGPALRADVRCMIESYLRQLYRQSAFVGATEDQAFFVRCDEALNPQRVLDAGELICEVGVAPAEPLEFILLRIARSGDGTIRVEG
jgi:hypothetical protein